MRDDKHTAIHEAGHAVAYMRLAPEGAVSERLSIVEDAETLGRHGCEIFCFPEPNDDGIVIVDPALGHKQAICCCASYAALLAAGYSEDEALDGTSDDFDKAEDFTDVPLATIKQQAVELMCLSENIAAVARIADELLRRKTIFGEQVETLIELSDGTISEDDYQAISRMQRWD